MTLVLRVGLSASITDSTSSFSSNVALRPQRPYGLLGTGSPGRPPRLSQLLSSAIILVSEFLLFNVHGGEKPYEGRGAKIIQNDTTLYIDRTLSLSL